MSGKRVYKALGQGNGDPSPPTTDDSPEFGLRPLQHPDPTAEMPRILRCCLVAGNPRQAKGAVAAGDNPLYVPMS